MSTFQINIFIELARKSLGLEAYEIFVSSNSELSAPQCSTQHTPDSRGDDLDIVVHQRVQLSEVTNMLDSDHLPEFTMFSILDLLTMRET
jgi:hypothetical protein